MTIQELISEYALTIIETASGMPMLVTPFADKAKQTGAMFEIMHRKDEIVAALKQRDKIIDAFNAVPEKYIESLSPSTLRQNVVKIAYLATFHKPDGSAFQREISAESLPAAKLCAKAVAQQAGAKVTSISLKP